MGLEYDDDSTYWDEEIWVNSIFHPEEKFEKDGSYKLKWDFKKKAVVEPFEYGEEKYMEFKVEGSLPEGVFGNDISVKPGEKSMGAFQAPITVGEPEGYSIPHGYLVIKKETDTDIIYPNEATIVTYTVTAENVDVVPVIIYYIQDWLPTTGVEGDGVANPVFVYLENSTSANITSANQTITEVPLPDTYGGKADDDILQKYWIDWADQKKEEGLIMRWELLWDLTNHQDARFDPIFTEPGDVLTMAFSCNVTLEASGYYLNEFILDVMRYPLEVVKTLDPPPIPPDCYPPHPNDVHITVTMENVDTDNVTIEKIEKAYLPGPDTGDEGDAFIYDNNVSGFITRTDESTYDIDLDEGDVKDNKWDNKKKRWKVSWDFDNVLLEPGETLTIEFDTIVDPSKMGISHSELLWEVKIKEEKDNARKLYSFPTAGVMVPMYDLNTETLGSILSTNAWLGGGHKIHPHSKHWKKHK